MPRKIAILIIVLALLLSGCNMPNTTDPAPTADANAVITAAAATAYAQLTGVAGLATDTPSPTLTSTPEPPTLTPTPTVELTLVPMDAICIDNSRVRSWPGGGGEFLGGVLYGRGVKVLARNANGNWLLIDFPEAAVGRGWILSGGVELKDDVAKLPIALELPEGQLAFVPAPSWTVVGTPLPLPPVPKDDSARPATVLQVATVRICPSKSCQAIGYLQVNDVINMTGRFGENKWAQFQYPSGPDGKGWVIRDAIQPSDAAFGGLPYFDLLGKLVTPEPPTSTPDPNQSPTPTRTATPLPAGPLVEIVAETVVYEKMSSLSPVVGTLNAKDRVRITYQSINLLWYEIEYPVDSGKRAYISASNKYVRLLPGQDYRYMKYTDALGTPLAP
jgi:hypothetical protein